MTEHGGQVVDGMLPVWELAGALGGADVRGAAGPPVPVQYCTQYCTIVQKNTVQ